MRVESTSRSRATSPVIAAVIMSAVVLAIGSVIWTFSQGTMTITAEDYAETVVNMTDTICERFIVEHVNNSETELSVWIYNYGDVDIEVNVTYPENDNGWEKVVSKELKRIDIGFNPVSETEVGINVKSRRDNDVCYRYFVP